MKLSEGSSKGIIYVMAMCFTNSQSSACDQDLEQSLVIKVKSVSVCKNEVDEVRFYFISEPSVTINHSSI